MSNAGWDRDDLNGDEKRIYEYPPDAFDAAPRALLELTGEKLMDSKNVIAIVVAVGVVLAFLAVVIAPVFGAHTDPQTSVAVIGLFTALAGAFAGTAYKQQQVNAAQADAKHAQAMMEAAQSVAAQARRDNA